MRPGSPAPKGTPIPPRLKREGLSGPFPVTHTSTEVRESVIVGFWQDRRERVGAPTASFAISPKKAPPKGPINRALTILPFVQKYQLDIGQNCPGIS